MARANNRLAGKANFDMQAYVREHYAAAGLHDKEFAEKASAELGFYITAGNVQGAREVFGIASTRDVQRTTPGDEVADLRKRLAALEQRVEVYLTGCTLPGCPQVKG